MKKFIRAIAQNNETILINPEFIKFVTPTGKTSIVHFEHGFQPVIEPLFDDLILLLCNTETED